MKNGVGLQPLKGQTIAWQTNTSMASCFHTEPAAPMGCKEIKVNSLYLIQQLVSNNYYK